MPLPWIQVDAHLKSHRKAVELAAMINDPRAWAYLVDLWSWASQSEPSGVIRGPAARMVIEHVVGWRGETGQLTDALIACHWLDEVSDGLAFHDWNEHQGAHIQKAAEDTERKRKWRKDKVPSPVPVAVRVASQSPSTSRDADATRGGAVRGEESRGEEKEPTSYSAQVVTAPLLSPKAPDNPLSDGFAFFAHVQHERHGVGLPREKPPHPSRLGAWWSEVLMDLNGNAEPLVAAYRGYAADKFWRDKAPPLPFPGFMSQWRKYVPTQPV